MEIAEIEQIKLEKLSEIYQQRFSDASQFQFLLVGNIDNTQVEPLIEQYLASLPSSNSAKKGIGEHIPPRKFEDANIEIYADIGDQSRVSLFWHKNMKMELEKAYHLQALSDILEARLLKQLRENMSGVYNVSVNTKGWAYPEKGYGVGISFGCDPTRAKELKAAVMVELEKIKKELVFEEEIATIKEKSKRRMEEAVKTNNFWVTVIRESFKKQKDPKEFLRWEEIMKEMTPQDIQDAANGIFTNATTIHVTMLPKKK